MQLITEYTLSHVAGRRLWHPPYGVHTRMTHSAMKRAWAVQMVEGMASCCIVFHTLHFVLDSISWWEIQAIWEVLFNGLSW